MADSSHGGRVSSWLTVAVMLVGFVIGGLGLVIGPAWALFWVGIAVVAVGGVLALAVGIFSDVVMYEPSDIIEEAETAPATSQAETETAETAPVETRETG
jgi:fatty acid desaturase